MDRTSVFKALVKTLRTSKKFQNNGIMSRSRPMSVFSRKTREVVQNITKLRDFLLEHRHDYINAAGHLTGDTSQLTDQDRDQIDLEAQNYMKTCSSLIANLKTEAFRENITDQQRLHREGVFGLLEGYLKDVCKLYSQQRAVRVKRVVDRKRISRLHSETSRLEIKPYNPLEPNTSPVVVSESEKCSDQDDEIDKQLTAEELQMFEEENVQLFSNMSTLVDEVRQIEGKVVELSKLQQFFTEKVLEQAGTIERIQDTCVEATENVREGNEQIREAIKNNAGFRVWILFFLVMCSVSLLFLDWYS
ncbi:syntaxin-18-like [Corticium candelabrum]|uniref:syntaxin-18-like n=1 Tax=Corticium candelabrum TaxID=121492 RepID=UPI002E2674C2|nr:syntaxin-18-like [Corticium candelabrum]